MAALPDLDPRLITRLSRMHITDMDAVRLYLAAHPNGCEVIGRVDLLALQDAVAEADAQPS